MKGTTALIPAALFFKAIVSHPTVETVDPSMAPLSYPAQPLGHMNFSDYVTLLKRSDVERRQPGGVFLATDINWGGTTGYATQPYDVCIHLDAPWYHTISSLGPDSGNAVALSEDYNCNNAGYAIFYPGIANLVNINWNDRIGSFVVRQVAVVNGRECVKFPFAGTNCQTCCNGCNRSGQGCCPDGQHC